MQHDFLLQNSNDNIHSEENDLTMSQKKPGADVDVHKLWVLKIHICEAGQCCKNLLRIFESVCTTSAGGNSAAQS